MKLGFTNTFLTLFLVSLFATSALAQQIDTTLSVIDTTLTDSTLILPNDSLDANGNPFTAMRWEAELEEFDLSTGILVLNGTEDIPAKVFYDDMEIEAIKITYYKNRNFVVAEGKYVTANPDSFPDGKRYIGKPVLIQAGQDPMTGIKMNFNLETKKGSIEEGRTKIQDDYFFGKNITKLDKDFIQIKDGYFTSCDLEGKPHFHFSAKRMKMKIKNKVVAKPIVFYISDIPIFALPFGFIPIENENRASGFVLPSYGNSFTEGRYLQGGGFYFAINDYMDANFLMDFYDKRGFKYNGDFSYRKRYNYNGYISASLFKLHTGDKLDPNYTESQDWSTSFNHSQQFEGRDMTLSINGGYQSSNSVNKIGSRNRTTRANSSIRSNATLNKRFGSNSLTINASRVQSLTNESLTETLPNISFNRGNPIFPFKNSNGLGEDNFLSSVNIRYNSTLKNQRSKTLTSIIDSTYTEKSSYGVNHTISMSAPQKILKYIGINPSLRYTEDWTNKLTIQSVDSLNRIVREEEKGFFTRRIYNMSVSGNTKFYGTFNPNIGKLKTIRHVVTPNVSFSFSPNFSDDKYGYYSTYVDTSGETKDYDRYSGSINGGTSSRTNKFLSLSVSNLIQAKTQDGEEENKFDIISFTTGTNYNFNAPKGVNKFGLLSTGGYLKKWADLRFSLTHDLYETQYDSLNIRIQDKFVAGSGNIFNFAKFRSFNLSTDFVLKSRKPEKIEPAEETEDFGESDFLNAQNDKKNNLLKLNDQPQNELAELNIPWELRVGLIGSVSKPRSGLTNKNFNATVKFSTHLTEGWKFEYRSAIDLVSKVLAFQDFSFNRDLHCWELSATWTPPNYSNAGFWLEVRIKNPRLKDFKYKKQSRGLYR